MECLEFQREIDKGENDELKKLLSEKEFFENEIRLLEQKNDSLKNSMLAFVEEVLLDLQDSNSGNTTPHNKHVLNFLCLKVSLLQSRGYSPSFFHSIYFDFFFLPSHYSHWTSIYAMFYHNHIFY